MLSHQFLFNKLFSTANIPKNYTVCNISYRFNWNNCLSKNEKEIDSFLLFKQRANEKIMELSSAANFFQ